MQFLHVPLAGGVAGGGLGQPLLGGLRAGPLRLTVCYAYTAYVGEGLRQLYAAPRRQRRGTGGPLLTLSSPAMRSLASARPAASARSRAASAARDSSRTAPRWLAPSSWLCTCGGQSCGRTHKTRLGVTRRKGWYKFLVDLW